MMDDLLPIKPVSGGSAATQGKPALTPERWREIKEIFSLAMEREPNDRTAFLDQACEKDEWLRAEVESLLQSSAREEAATGEMLKAVSSQPLALAVEQAQDPWLGRRVGDYRIERRIGYGGMAAVYLASRADEQFQMQAAIKLLRLDLDHADLLRRFLNERQTLAALDHPNIVKLLDGGSTEEGLPYLVMDYVEGLPIDEYCDARTLSIPQRLQVFCTVCDAVTYAHQHHVIHRDLKPNNILVTGEGTPKLLDFGIAKVLATSDASPTSTQTANRHLTPAFASPEQVRGGNVAPTTDVYSLGVVLYSLLTGRRPYKVKERTPAALERAICEQEPESPSTAVDRVETETRPDGTTVTITAESVSRTREGQPEKLRRSLRGDLDNIVIKALQKEPWRRYQSVAELTEDIRRHLEHRPVKARPNTVGYRLSKFARRHKTEVIAALCVLLFVCGTIGFSIWLERRADERARAEFGIPRSGGRRTIAVLGFKNLSDRSDLNWLSTALSEMLTTELAAGGKVRIIPGEVVAQTKLDLSLTQADSFRASTLRRIYKNLGSDYVVVGSYLDTGAEPEQIRLDLRLQDAVKGDTVVVTWANANRTDLAELVRRAASGLREKLGLSAPSLNEVSSIQASQPGNTEAAQLYAEGLEKQRTFDAQQARDLLLKAVADDPNFALAHLALSDAWTSLGDIPQAREEAKRAFDLSSALPREQSLMVEARYYEVLHQWDKAIEIRRTLFNFFPDNIDHGLQLARTQTLAAKGPDSLATVESLRRLPVPERNDPRIDLAEAYSANVVSDYKRQLSAAQQAIKKAQAVGARLLIANARGVEARAYLEMGQKDKVGPALSEAREIYASVGDRFHQARILQQVGLSLFYQGKMEEAKNTYLQALVIQRELGNRANEAKLINGIAMVLHHENDLEGAEKNYLQALEICREIDDRAMTGTVLGNVAGIEVELGKFHSAGIYLRESLDIARRVGEQSGIALALENLATVMVQEGNLRGAIPLYEEGLQISRKTQKNQDLTAILIDRGDLQLHLGQLAAARSSYQEAQKISAGAGDEARVGLAIRGVGAVQFEQDQLAAARESYEQARKLLEKAGDKRYSQDVQIALAELDIEEGRPADAERESRLAAEAFRKANDWDGLASAEILVARALFAERKTDAALETATDVSGLTAKIGRATQLVAASIAAEIQIPSGKAAIAAKTLTQVAADCHKAGFVPEEFRARLALAEAKMKVGDVAGGRAQFASLEHDARTKGFFLTARKAHLAMTKTHGS